ncbi:MAG: hypothetical protein HKN62_16920 [Phycisphaerales bacterium]|nr:hypothetical protein [Phycisphaerales bacterium]
MPDRPNRRRIANRPVLLLTGVLLAAATMIAPPASAQTPQADLRRQGLDPQPLAIESMGLRFNPPLEAMVQAQRIGERMTVTLVDSAAQPAWSMSIQRRTSTLRDASPAAQIDHLLATLRTNQTPFEMIGSEPVTYGGLPGQVCYIRQQTPAGQTIFNGWTMLDVGRPDFLVFAVQILDPAEFPRIRSLVDAALRTVDMTDLTRVADERRLRLDAGAAFLESVTPEQLRTLIGPTRWYRYFAPSSQSGSGAETELGYYAVTFKEGMRGEINADRKPTEFNVSERVTGLLVHVQGHYIDVEQSLTYDSDARYWMSWDQTEEAWSIIGTRRHGRLSESEAVTGIRTPASTADPNGTLTIVVSGRDGTTRDQKSWPVPDVYLSQAVRWGLGPLLPRDRGAMIMSAYCVDSTSAEPKVSLRIDRWEPVRSGSTEWMLTSQARSEAPKIVSRYDRFGALTTRTWPDGRITRPIELSALHDLWRRKGLPTKGMGNGR